MAVGNIGRGVACNAPSDRPPAPRKGGARQPLPAVGAAVAVPLTVEPCVELHHTEEELARWLPRQPVDEMRLAHHALVEFGVIDRDRSSREDGLYLRPELGPARRALHCGIRDPVHAGGGDWNAVRWVHKRL